MLHQFRHLYPQGSLISELINIDRGLYIVKVSVQNEETIFGTGLAAAETIEKAEDKARERALMTVNLKQLEQSAISPQTSQSQPTAAQNVVTATPRNQTSNHNSYNLPSVTLSSPEKVVSSPVKTPEPNTQQEIADFVPTTITEDKARETTPVIEPQTNIFDQPLTPPPPEETTPVEAENTLELDFNEIRHKIDLEMKRLSWTKEQGRDYLLSTYGKRSRLHLTDEELLEFWHYLENLSG